MTLENYTTNSSAGTDSANWRWRKRTLNTVNHCDCCHMWPCLWSHASTA